MNKHILNSEVQDFINSNLNTDISKLIFKGSPFKNISIQEIAEQIESKKKCAKKLPSWFNTKNIYYPNKLNIEQTSSEITANYKANLISGNSIIDLTGGFGVDCYSFSKRFKQVIHCEINESLTEKTRFNFNQLTCNNIETICEDGISYLDKTNQNFDWIYVDPSRRNDHKGKVFLLKDCLPNIPENLSTLFKYSNNILIKSSPILDIKGGISDLNSVKEVCVIAVKNEVKELLFLLQKDYLGPIIIKTTNLNTNNTQQFNFELGNQIESKYHLPLKYLYEPNAAILKSGGFQEVSSQFNIYKLHQHSHLYTSDSLIDFPGRRFTINHYTSPDKKSLKKLIPSKKANITTRNYPETVNEIRKKTKIKDGGDQFLFFTTDKENKRIALFCEKV